MDQVPDRGIGRRVQNEDFRGVEILFFNRNVKFDTKPYGTSLAN
jgi:hypothetical protein